MRDMFSGMLQLHLLVSLFGGFEHHLLAYNVSFLVMFGWKCLAGNMTGTLKQGHICGTQPDQLRRGLSSSS